MSIRKWLNPIVDSSRAATAVREYVYHWRAWRRYSRMQGSGNLAFRDAYPCLFDRTSFTPFDSHYFYQQVWAFNHILKSGVSTHVDVGSHVAFVGLLASITTAMFVDIRPARVRIDNFASVSGDIVRLPLSSMSVNSLSCLHVAEHIGLGRYGDALDPEGTIKAAGELARVLAPGGDLYFSLPLGRSRVCFNAHRIHQPGQIIEYFSNLTLVDFSAIDDSGTLKGNIDPNEVANATYACGLFHFSKPV